MTTFALIHGAGDGGWAWHLVRDALRARGHEAVGHCVRLSRPDELAGLLARSAT